MSIDPSVLIWTIINFILLMILLNRFLFKPILAFIKKRQQQIDDGISAGKKSDELFKNKEQELSEKLSTAKQDFSERSNKAVNNALSESEKAILQAEKDSASVRLAKTQQITDEETELKQLLENNIPSYINVFCDNLCAVYGLERN